MRGYHGRVATEGASPAATDDLIEAGATALDRVVFFSDAVMAIAITLLAFDLRLPDVSNMNDARFLQLLADLAPRYFAFALGFAVIGIYWFAHHRMFRFIVRWTNGLLAANLLFLFFVVQMPFLTSVLGASGNVPLPTALYAVGLAAIGFSVAGMWTYAIRRGLLSPAVDHHYARFLQLRLLIPPVVFALSVPIAFIAPILAQLVWTAVYFGQLWLSRRTPAAHA